MPERSECRARRTERCAWAREWGSPEPKYSQTSCNVPANASPESRTKTMRLDADEAHDAFDARVPPPAPARTALVIHGSALLRRPMKLVSEYWPVKYLLSDHGLCLGIDTARCSYLFLAHRGGLLLRRRPVGDRIVEDLDYEIPAIVARLDAERAASPAAP